MLKTLRPLSDSPCPPGCAGLSLAGTTLSGRDGVLWLLYFSGRPTGFSSQRARGVNCGGRWLLHLSRSAVLCRKDFPVGESRANRQLSAIKQRLAPESNPHREAGAESSPEVHFEEVCCCYGHSWEYSHQKLMLVDKLSARHSASQNQAFAVSSSTGLLGNSQP
jgi:hypothetical protein